MMSQPWLFESLYLVSIYQKTILNGPYTQRRKLTVVYSLLIHDCTTFTSRKNVLNENTCQNRRYPNHYIL